MCLGYPGEVLRIDGATAVIDCWGTQRVVQIETLDETILPGDFVIADEDVVVRRIPPQEIDRTIELYETVLVEA